VSAAAAVAGVVQVAGGLVVAPLLPGLVQLGKARLQGRCSRVRGDARAAARRGARRLRARLGVLGAVGEVVGPVEDVLPVDLRIPGLPAEPAAIAEALLALLDQPPASLTR
jgi:coenzyme F420-reducing hydrogenase gamma subunit